jgi:molybdenum-dependent DNA-binding transcriptional regulator ModE
MPKIDLKTVQRIIREEILNLNEGDDHKTGAKVMSSAANMLSAIESFKDAASEKAKAELGDHLDSIEEILKRIISSPMNYVDTVQGPQFKKVTFKPTKDNVV